MKKVDYPSNACSLLWSHGCAQPNGDLIPCCRWDWWSTNSKYTPPKINEVGFDAAWNSDMFVDVRERMLRNERLAECHKCWTAESSASKLSQTASMRRSYNHRWGKHIGEEPKLRYLEIGLGTTCNLACRMCSETYSSKIATIKNPNKSYQQGYDLDLDKMDIDLSNLERIKIMGGEPLLARDHHKFLAQLLETHPNPEKIILQYCTNGTVKPTQDIIDFWNQIGWIHLRVSIDGVGKINEIQRPGHKWETIQDTWNYFLSLQKEVQKPYTSTRVKTPLLQINTVITRLNLFHLDELGEWIKQNNETMDMNGPYRGGFPVWQMSPALYPLHLSIVQMDDETKKRAREYINDAKNIPDNAKRLVLVHLDKPATHEFTQEEVQAELQTMDDFFNQTAMDIYQ